MKVQNTNKLMMETIKKSLYYFLGALCISNFAHAEDSQIYIKIGEAKAKKSQLALPPLLFFGTPATATKFNKIGTELFSIINNDLEVSALFKFIPQSSFIENVAKTGLKPAPTEANGFKFESWISLQTDFLIRAGFSIAGSEVTLETYLYHVPKSQLIMGKKYKGSSDSVRRLAHTFANDVVKTLTGEESMFLSKIAVASDRGGGKFKEIYVMDWDGANAQSITSHKSLALSPAWTNDGKKIAYTAFVQRAKSKMRNADMFIYELATGKRILVSYRHGLNSGAAFTPDAQFLLLTLSHPNPKQPGNPDIYKMNLDGDLVQKITNGPSGAMNVEPSVSPDGKRVAFSSDRHGHPMIYIMDINGSNVNRITYAGVFNASPSWSPDGKKIAFAGQSDDHFDIFVVNTDKTNMIRITEAKKKSGKAADNEDPSFSPDGRFLMYTSNRTGKNQIYISTADGSEERAVTQDNHNYFRPKWSKNF